MRARACMDDLKCQAMFCVQTVEEVAARRKVRHRVEMINQDAPATCSDQVTPSH